MVILVITELLVGAFNFSHLLDGGIDYALTPFQLVVGYLLWGIIFSGVIGIVYKATHDLGSVTAVVFLIFGLFGTTNHFVQAPELSVLFFWIAVAGYAGCVLSLFIKKRHEN